jgi:hypothetical protein
MSMIGDLQTADSNKEGLRRRLSRFRVSVFSVLEGLNPALRDDESKVCAASAFPWEAPRMFVCPGGEGSRIGEAKRHEVKKTIS